MPIIRLARPDDLDRLAWVESSAASVFRDVAGLEWIADGPTMEPAALAVSCRDGLLWVAADDADHPVGFLAAQKLDGKLHIAEISVARCQQKQGLGAGLIAAAVDFARLKAFSAVTLTTYRNLSWNGPFYARLGFVEVDPADVEPVYREKLNEEAAAGHDPSKRCLMTMNLR
jgi:GNAT superfamily N-acetyltransferase